MNFQHYLYLFLRYSWLIILILAAVLAGTWAWLGTQAPVYASRAVMEVEMQEANVVKIEEVKDTRVTGLEALNTVVQTLGSNTMMLAVAKTAGQTEQWAALNPENKPGPATESALAEYVRKKFKISLRRNTRLIEIVAEAKSGEEARALASGLVEQFMDLQNRDQSDVSKNANRFLVEEAKKLKAKLEDSENKLAEYRQKHNAVSLDEGLNIVSDRLKDLNERVTQANGDRARLESDLAALKQVRPGDVEAMLKLKSVADLPEVADLRKTLAAKEAKFSAVKERYLELHPKYGAAQSEVNEARGKLGTAIASAGDTLRQQYRSFAQTEQKLKDLLAEEEGKALELGQMSIPYNALKREAETDRSLYETILTRLKETDVTQGLTKNPYRITEEPLINPDPVWPKRSLSLLIAAFAGLAAGTGLVLLLDHMDSSIRTVDDAEQVLGFGVLSAVPEGDLSKLPKGGTVMTDDFNSSQAEAFRTLRASLSLLGDEEQRRLILVTSAIPSEGKTFNSTNLGAAFATQGLSTLLIDADLRRPALSATLIEPDIRRGSEFRGLTDVLSGLCTVHEAIRATNIQNLQLLPSGRKAPNPSELLSQGGMGKLLQQLLQDYDRIVIDSAPVNAVSDSLGIAPHAHAVCLVLRYGSTPRRAVIRALTLLEKAGARMAGLVMNRMPVNRGASYYYYYYGDSYVGESKKGKKGRKGQPANEEVEGRLPPVLTSPLRQVSAQAKKQAAGGPPV